MIQKEFLDFVAPSGMLAKRFVTITKSTDTVAYTTAGATPDGITIGDEDGLVIAIQILGNLGASFWFDAGGTISKGDEVQVGTDGKGVIQTSGAIACYAKIAAVDGSFGVGYNTVASSGSAVGTPSTGVVAVEEVNGSLHKTTLTVDSAMGAIAGGADLALGKALYTLPAGVKSVKVSYMSLALTAVDGNIDADTPDGGIGTTLASGVVNVLGGTAGFENILTGQAFNNCTGTAEVKTVVDQPLVIETGDSHVIYFNIADGWAASGETALPVAGTVIIEWSNI